MLFQLGKLISWIRGTKSEKNYEDSFTEEEEIIPENF